MELQIRTKQNVHNNVLLAIIKPQIQKAILIFCVAYECFQCKEFIKREGIVFLQRMHNPKENFIWPTCQYWRQKSALASKPSQYLWNICREQFLFPAQLFTEYVPPFSSDRTTSIDVTPKSTGQYSHLQLRIHIKPFNYPLTYNLGPFFAKVI